MQTSVSTVQVHALCKYSVLPSYPRFGPFDPLFDFNYHSFHRTARTTSHSRPLRPLLRNNTLLFLTLSERVSVLWAPLQYWLRLERSPIPLLVIWRRAWITKLIERWEGIDCKDKKEGWRVRIWNERSFNRSEVRLSFGGRADHELSFSLEGIPE